MKAKRSANTITPEGALTFAQALEKTVRWYVDNECWWRKIKSGQHYQEYYRQNYGEREIIRQVI